MGFDYNPALTSIGPGSIERCKAAQDMFWRLNACNVSAYFVVSPGFSPNIEKDIQVKTMAEMMCAWFVSAGFDPGRVEIGTPTWGSRKEIYAAIKAIQDCGGLNKKSREVWVVSSWYHIPRLWVIAKILDRKLGLNWRWRFHSAPGNWDVLKTEIPSFIGEVIRMPFWKPTTD